MPIDYPSVITKYRSFTCLMILTLLPLVVFACAAEDPENIVPYITDLIVYERNGDFILGIEGELPYECVEIEEIEQDVDDSMIMISLKAVIPEGIKCPRSLTTFQIEVLLDITELESGVYVVDVHNVLADVNIP